MILSESEHREIARSVYKRLGDTVEQSTREAEIFVLIRRFALELGITRFKSNVTGSDIAKMILKQIGECND